MVNGYISGNLGKECLLFNESIVLAACQNISPNKNPPGKAMSIAKPMEMELTWILLKGLKNFKLLILGF